jgi:peptide chain release factor subunit 1
MLLIEWLANHYKEFGTVLEIVTDRSQEGSQFCRGFGGIGGESSRANINCTNVC